MLAVLFSLLDSFSWFIGKWEKLHFLSFSEFTRIIIYIKHQIYIAKAQTFSLYFVALVLIFLSSFFPGLLKPGSWTRIHCVLWLNVIQHHLPIHSKLIHSFHSSFPGLWLARLFSFLCSHWLSVVTSSVSALVPVKVKWAKTWSPFMPPEWLQSSGVSGTGMQVWVRTTMPWSSWDKITNH